MATQVSCTSLIWVIEALASFDEIDTSLLIDLVKRAPEMSHDLGKNAKDIVSLRVLESLFIQKTSNTNNVASVPSDKVELDPSKSCEDVLRHILSEVPALDLKTAVPEMLKWDIQSFIMKRRSTLLKCFLQQLKDAIVDSTSPLAASLRERSGLELGNHSRDSVPVAVVDFDGLRQGIELGSNLNHEAKHDMGSNLLQDFENGEPSRGAKANMAKNLECDCSTDSEVYYDERADLAAMESDLSLHYAQSEDSRAMVDCSELNLCVKCNESGELLACSSEACHTVVHASCLSSVPNVDHNGNVCCPLCAYSHAISEYLEGKKNVSLAKKVLGAFIGSGAGAGAGTRLKKPLPRSQGMKQNRDKNEQLNHNEKGGNNLNEFTESGSSLANRNCVGAQVMQMDSPQPEASVPEKCSVAGQQPDKPLLRCHRSKHNQSRDKEDLHHNENRNKNSLEDKKVESGPEVMHMHPPQPFPRDPVCQESFEEDNESHRFCVRSRNPVKDTTPTTHRMRRKKVKWTTIEEETLEEGYQRFKGYHDTWKRILEFGCDVFHTGRTAVDLKDKWRNITKGKKRKRVT